MRQRGRRNGLTRLLVLTGIGAVIGTACCGSSPQAFRDVARTSRVGEAWPGERWSQIDDPALLGWSPGGLADAKRFSARIGSAAVMIIQDGLIVEQWGDVSQPHNVRSIRKSLLSALIGMAVAEDRLALEATLAELGIDDEPPLLPAERRARLEDLLTSRSGVYHDAAYETSEAERRRPPRGSHAPGSFFYYNNWDFNALGTIFERRTGEPVFEAFERRLARPLRMQDFALSHTQYRRERSSVHPAYLFRLSARDLARFGLLHLSSGRWDGRQLLPSEWVERSTRAHVPEARAGQGYGYLWWVLVPPSSEPGAFLATGNGGQYVFVSPRRRAVVVHLTDTDGLWWKRLVGRAVKTSDAYQLLRLIMAAAPASPASPATGRASARPNG